MVRIKSKIRAISILLLVGLFFTGLVGKTATPVLADISSSGKISALAYHDEWRKLWEDHITWTRVVILGILDELPGTNAYLDRLIKNYEDMEDALAPYYGDEAEVLGDLIQEHLVIAAEILTAAHDGNSTAVNDAVTRWYANGEAIAVQMNEMNPSSWPLDEAKQMWKDHLDATLEEALANLNGGYPAEVAAYDRVHDLALEMADFISSGVIKQFPQKFLGKVR